MFGGEARGRDLSIKSSQYSPKRQSALGFHVQDNVERAILDAMGDDTVTRFTVTKRGGEGILLENEQELPKGADLIAAVSSQKFQTLTIKRHEGQTVRVSRTISLKISKGTLKRQ